MSDNECRPSDHDAAVGSLHVVARVGHGQRGVSAVWEWHGTSWRSGPKRLTSRSPKFAHEQGWRYVCPEATP